MANVAAGYLPTDLGCVAMVMAALLIGLLLSRSTQGLLLSSTPARLIAWGIAVAIVPLMAWLTTPEPAGVRMLAIIAALMLAMKGIVCMEDIRKGGETLPFSKWLGFVAAWPGMRPRAFHDVGNPQRGNLAKVRKYAIKGSARLIFGAVMILLADVILQHHPLSWGFYSGIGFLLVGLSFVFHFGLFNLLVAWWRWRGVKVSSLFQFPLRSTTLTEFWGRRWNIAFAEMTAISVFRPLRKPLGMRLAVLSAFLFSGLLHELAISLPVRAGYGLPMLYFALHALAMQIEVACSTKGFILDQNPWVGRVWTLLWILLPLPLLFHRPFLVGCVLPLLPSRW